MNENPFRYGILGTAGIARKNWRAIRDTGNSAVAAVASRDAERSRQFVAECQSRLPFQHTPEALGSYEALLEDRDVEAVYIPLPTGLRKEWVLRAAAAGKHVICEKPCGLTAGDVREMIAACEQHGVQFMDGVMFTHNLRMKRVRELLDDKVSIGPIKRITSLHTFAVAEEFFGRDIRAQSELEPTGSLGDLGWYCIRFALWAMRWQMPREVIGRTLFRRGGKNSPAPVPIDFSGELIFSEDTSADFFSSFQTAKQQLIHISGAKGSLRFPDFVHPWNEHEPMIDVDGVVQHVKVCDCEGKHTDSRSTGQDTNLFRNFATQVRSGRLNPEWPMMALKTQQVMDACYVSANNGGLAVNMR
jgi:predicted dehydrogenase